MIRDAIWLLTRLLVVKKSNACPTRKSFNTRGKSFITNKNFHTFWTDDRKTTLSFLVGNFA